MNTKNKTHKLKKCPLCEGHGCHKSYVNPVCVYGCTECSGTGLVPNPVASVKINSCPRCSGVGYVLVARHYSIIGGGAQRWEACLDCKGTGHGKEKVTIRVEQHTKGSYMACVRIGLLSNAIQVSAKTKKAAVAAATAAAETLGYCVVK